MKKPMSIVQQFTLLSLILSLFVLVESKAETVPEFKKWKKGENLIENGNFKDEKNAWTLEDGACCNRGGKYEWEVEKKVVKDGKKALKVIGVKATGTAWHAKIKHLLFNFNAAGQELYRCLLG